MRPPLQHPRRAADVKRGMRDITREDELLLLRVLESRLKRGLAQGDIEDDLESSLRQAGAVYRDRVAPLSPAELKTAVERLRS